MLTSDISLTRDPYYAKLVHPITLALPLPLTATSALTLPLSPSLTSIPSPNLKP